MNGIFNHMKYWFFIETCKDSTSSIYLPDILMPYKKEVTL